MVAFFFFVGGEDTSFRMRDSPGLLVDLQSGSFRSGYARCSVGPNLFGAPLAPANPSQVRLRTTNFGSIDGNQQTLWIHAQYFNGSLDNNGTAQAGCYYIAAMDTTGVYRLAARVPAVPAGPGQVELAKCNAAGTWTVLATSPTEAIPAASEPIQLDLFINYGTAGTIDLYANSTSIASYVGNLVTDSATGIGMVDFVGCAQTWCGDWSEIVISDTDTRGLVGVQTLPPAARVASGTAWAASSGSDVSDISKIYINDSTFIYAVSADQLSRFSLSSGSPLNPAAGAVLAFSFEARGMLNTGSGSLTGFYLTEQLVGGGTYDVQYFINAGTMDSYKGNFNASPDGSGDLWTIYSFNTGFSYGIESGP